MWSKCAAVCLVCLAFTAASSPATAQIHKLKEKAKEKTEKKVEKDETPADTSTADRTSGKKSSAKAGPTGSAAEEDMSLYTKFDFVPGDKVIFYDDLSGEEISEFPSRWRLDRGVFEIARQGDKKYILCTDGGTIRPKITPGAFPPTYTIEMEFFIGGGELEGHWFFIKWYDPEGEEIGSFSIKDKVETELILMTKTIASKTLSAPLTGGLHAMRVMATQSTLKCYIDTERVANVPAVGDFKPVDIGVYMDPWLDEADNPMLVGTFRYAEGGKTLKEQLDESGRIITHGILFDSGSDRIQGESYQTLKNIGQLLTGNPTVHVSIEGHTDSDGTDEFNMTLSQKRAAAVRNYLIENYKIAPESLQSRGWGESKPIDTNATPEGKANNRRVELVKE